MANAVLESFGAHTILDEADMSYLALSLEGPMPSKANSAKEKISYRARCSI